MDTSRAIAIFGFPDDLRRSVEEAIAKGLLVVSENDSEAHLQRMLSLDPEPPLLIVDSISAPPESKKRKKPEHTDVTGFFERNKNRRRT